MSYEREKVSIWSGCQKAKIYKLNPGVKSEPHMTVP